jgi:putative ABC transport system ATP-binding protein
MGIVLEIQELTKEYSRSGRAFNAVDNVNLTITAGDFISIIGRSGSGKSTLLNMTAGLLKPTKGNILFDGKNITGFNDEEISLLRNEKIGYVPQGQNLLSNFTVLENVCIPWYLFKREGGSSSASQPLSASQPEQRALALLEKTGISHLASSYPRELSGGEMRRVAIARALINSPALLIADEPTSDLDVETTAEIMKLFSTVANEGTSVLIVTHELDTLNYGNKTYSMSAGLLTPLPQEEKNEN